ncbi:MAG: hypothetical protein WAK82_28445 [Streptosporangiaceae bacterium]
MERKSHFSALLSPGTRLVAAMAPALTIGFDRPSALRSTKASESNASPVAFTPSWRRTCSAPSVSHTRAKTKGLATLMIVNSCPVSPARQMLPLMPTTQMPNRSAGTRASAGYVCEVFPLTSARYIW